MTGNVMKKIILPKAVAVVGPTAAGKTKLGVELAKKFNGEIVSADSRQVFKYLDISTGKDLGDYVGVPYHLIDLLEPSEEITVADFQKKAFSAIGKILRRKKLPVVVGGSPFYVYAVTEGWQFPKIEKDEKLRKRLSKLTLQELRNILEKIDPAAFDKIDQKNPRRLIRAIEVCTLSGNDFEHAKPVAQPRYKVLLLGIKFSNEELKERIQSRLVERLNSGMIEEIQKIIKKKQAIYADLERLGLEPRFISYYLQKKINREQLEDLLLKNIYHFAKRQMTWFGKDKNIKWVSNLAEAETKVKRFLK
jgi:tRNA dimethylallyltransferase